MSSLRPCTRKPGRQLRAGQKRALAWRHDAVQPLAQAGRVQRVLARQVDGVARSPSNAAGLLEFNAKSTQGAFFVCRCQRLRRPRRAAAASGGRRESSHDDAACTVVTLFRQARNHRREIESARAARRVERRRIVNCALHEVGILARRVSRAKHCVEPLSVVHRVLIHLQPYQIKPL